MWVRAYAYACTHVHARAHAPAEQHGDDEVEEHVVRAYDEHHEVDERPAADRTERMLPDAHPALADGHDEDGGHRGADRVEVGSGELLRGFVTAIAPPAEELEAEQRKDEEDEQHEEHQVDKGGCRREDRDD